MYWLYEQWHAFADWAAGQPLYIQLAIGSAVLTVAYLLFSFTLSRLVRAPRLTPRRHSRVG